MGSSPCCSRVGLHRGPWTTGEDAQLIKYIQLHGEGHWRSLPKKAGRLPGRTDNEIKNYWNTTRSKKLKNQGTDPITHKELTTPLVLQEPKKRRNNRNNNSNSKKHNNIKTIVDAENTRVLDPKPIRLDSLKSFSVSRNNSFDWSGCSSQEGDRELEIRGQMIKMVMELDFSLAMLNLMILLTVQALHLSHLNLG